MLKYPSWSSLGTLYVVTWRRQHEPGRRLTTAHAMSLHFNQTLTAPQAAQSNVLPACDKSRHIRRFKSSLHRALHATLLYRFHTYALQAAVLCGSANIFCRRKAAIVLRSIRFFQGLRGRIFAVSCGSLYGFRTAENCGLNGGPHKSVKGYYRQWSNCKIVRREKIERRDKVGDGRSCRSS